MNVVVDKSRSLRSRPGRTLVATSALLMVMSMLVTVVMAMSHPQGNAATGMTATSVEDAIAIQEAENDQAQQALDERHRAMLAEIVGADPSVMADDHERMRSIVSVLAANPGGATSDLDVVRGRWVTKLDLDEDSLVLTHFLPLWSTATAAWPLLVVDDLEISGALVESSTTKRGGSQSQVRYTAIATLVPLDATTSGTDAQYLLLEAVSTDGGPLSQVSVTLMADAPQIEGKHTDNQHTGEATS